MKLLGIDTSAKCASAAVCTEDKIIISGTIHTNLTHSQTLLPLVKDLLKAAEIQLEDIDAYAVSKGPGSFTGIRIGVSAVKGFATAKNKECFGVSTLEALAYNLIGFDGIICPLMDARCKQVYNALFEIRNEKPERFCDDRAVSIEDLTNELKAFDKKIILVGDGAELCYESMKNEIKVIELAPLTLRYQLASSVCAAAFGKPPCTAEELVPSYLRLSQAERERKAKLSKEE